MLHLDELILSNLHILVDRIAKDAILHIPSYREAPLKQTLLRIEIWLQTLAESIQQNDPEILEQYVLSIAQERQVEDYPVDEIHAIIGVTERKTTDLITELPGSEVERTALSALLKAVMDATRMIVSVTYVIETTGKQGG